MSSFRRLKDAKRSLVSRLPATPSILSSTSLATANSSGILPAPTESIFHPRHENSRRGKQGESIDSGGVILTPVPASTNGKVVSLLPSAGNLSSDALENQGPTSQSRISPDVSGPAQTYAQHSSSARIEGIGAGDWPRLQALLKMLEYRSNAFTPLKLVLSELVECIDVFEREACIREDFSAIRGELENIFHDLQHHFSLEAPPNITTSMESLCSSVIKELEYVKKKQDRSKIHRLLEMGKDSDFILTCYHRIQGHLQRLLLNANLAIWRIVDDRATDDRLDRLNPSFSACFNSRQATELRRCACTPGTRTEVLAQLHDWVCHCAVGSVYWVNGMAGTGKTTIAYSLCSELKAAHNLGASFFCSRLLPECRDVNQIVPSIAYQLAEFSRPFRCSLARVLEKERNVHTQLLHFQFEMLVVKPLLEARDTLPVNLVVVIDALDECDDQQSTSHILEALLTKTTDLPIKFLITSRPEPQIRDQVKKQASVQAISRLVLHELDGGIVQGDIETYLRDALMPIEPSEDEVSRLAERAGILFIYAATVVRYIGYSNFRQNPRKRLRNVLSVSNGNGSNPYRDIDDLYTLILEAALDDPDIDYDDQDDRRLVLFTVICAQEPLTIGGLSGLLNLDIERVHAALRPLWSVLHVVESSELVTTLHASFPDYMFSPTRSKKNHCDALSQHYKLVLCCFGCIKSARVQFNICGLESSFIADDQIFNLRERVASAVSLELSYACRFWLGHLEFIKGSPEVIELLEDFLTMRLLFWMEVMNLQKAMNLGIRMIQQAEVWCKTQACAEELIKLVEDAWRFSATFTANAVSRSTCHIYVSMLPFWPMSQPIGKHYGSRMRSLVARGKSIVQRQYALLTIWTANNSTDLVTWSPDGTQVALVVGGKIQLRDSYSGQLALEPFGRDITSAAFSPDGTQILSGAASSGVIIWDTGGKKVLGPVEAGATTVQSVAFSPGGAQIAAGYRDRTIRIWDARTGQLILGPLKGHAAKITSLAFSPDGSRIASGSSDKSLQVWDTHSGHTLLDPLNGHAAVITVVAFSPSGTYIASGSYDRTVRLWTVRNGKTVLGPLEGHSGPVQSVAFSPNGARVVSGSSDSTVIVWDTQQGHKVLGPLRVHSGPVQSVAFSPDGTRIASASSDRTICMWDARSEDSMMPKVGAVKTHSSRIRSVAFSPDGIHVISSSDVDGQLGEIIVWDALTGQVMSQITLGKPSHDHSATSVAFTPDCSRIVIGSSNKTIYVWDVHTGRLILGPLNKHAREVTCCSFSPDGTRIVSGSLDKTIRMWDAHTGLIVNQPMMGHEDGVTSVAFSPDGSFIASGSSDGTLCIWAARTGQILYGPLELPGSKVTFIVFSPDGTRVVLGSEDGTICTWDMRTEKVTILPKRTYTKDRVTREMVLDKPQVGHTDAITSLAFSPSGAFFISGSLDKRIGVWDIRTGQTISWLTLDGPDDSITSVAFSPDGAHVASGSVSKAIHMWDVSRRHVKESLWRANFKLGTTANGWVVNAQNEPSLLVWVPADFRNRLKASPSPLLLWRSDEDLMLNLDNCNIGEAWSKCYQPPCI